MGLVVLPVHTLHADPRNAEFLSCTVSVLSFSWSSTVGGACNDTGVWLDECVSLFCAAFLFSLSWRFCRVYTG